MNIGIDGRALQGQPLGGVGQYTLQLLRALFSLDNKNEYHIFFNARGKLEIPDFSEFPNVQVHRLHWPNKLLNLSIKFLHRPFFPPLRVRRGQEGLDIFFMPNLNFVALTPQTKLIAVAHDLSFVHFPEYFSRKTQLWHRAINPRAFFNRADKIIAVSEHTKSDLVETYGIVPEKVSVFYPGVASPHCHSRESLPTGQAGGNPALNCGSPIPVGDDMRGGLPSPYILYFGALEPRKNIEGIVEAYELLGREMSQPPQLVIAGASTPYVERLKARIAQSAMRLHISVKENPTEEEKQKLYQGAALFVYPSFYEGFGFPPLEAMSHGVPVVASSASSVPEICGDAALLVNPWNVSEIKEAMGILLGNETVRKNYIAAGAARVKQFSWTASARQVISLFTTSIT